MEMTPEAQTDEQPFVEPKGYDPSLTERMGANAGEVMAGSVRGSLVTAAQAAGKAFQENPEDRDYAKANLQNRALDKALYDTMSWSDSPLEFGAAALGQVGGSLTSPESFINTLPGLGRLAGTATGRIASFGLSQGIVNTGQDALQQAVELSAGLRKSYDIAQTGLAFGLGTTLGTSFGGVGEVAARYMQYRRGGAGKPAAEPLKSDTEIAREDLSRAASEDPSMRGADEPATVIPQEKPDGQVTDLPARADLQQSQGRVPEAVAGHQGGVRADTAIGTTVPEARFGQQAGTESLSARVSQPKIAEDLGVDIPGTLLREIRGEPATVTAWHGSPHDHNRFSMDYVGTGEGAQAYGFGLYFAQAKQLGEHYRDTLARKASHGEEIYIDGKPPDWDNPSHQAATALFEADGKKEAAIAEIRDKLKRWEGDADAESHLKVWGEALRMLEHNEPLPKVDYGGHLYQVRINANPDHFLDWDKPFAKQSPSVQKALMSIPGFDKSPGVNTALPMGEQIKRGLLPNSYDSASASFSRAYREAGIPGIKYLDAGSRKTGEGSRNFVVFDDKAIQIIGKDGKPVPLNEYMRGQAEARFVEAVQAKAITPELRADITPPASAKSPAEKIVRVALESEPKTVGELESAIVKAANDTAPEGIQVKAESVEAIKEAVRDTVAGPEEKALLPHDSSLNRDASWVIRNKATGEVLFETFDKKVVDALNTAKYEAVGIREYLGSINGAKKKLADAEGMQYRRQTGQQNIPPAGQTATAAGAPTKEVLSLHTQVLKLAEDLDLPTFQGRVGGGKTALGQFDERQGVARLKVIADFATAAHEAGHAIEQKVGKPLKDLIQTAHFELAPLDYDTARMDPREGFAMWVEHWLTNPAYAANEAPRFAADFERLMADNKPDILKALKDAQAAHAAWVNAPAGQKVAAIVKTQEPETVLRTIKEEGMAPTVSLAVGKAYEGLFDDKAAVTQAVRSIARMARDASGARMKLEGADNPENLVRLFARNAQAAVRDMLVGVKGYRQITSSSPSLRDAIIMATGQKGLLGSWNTAKVKEFSDYLVLRRAAVLFDKHERGELLNRPLAMSKGDVLQGIVDAEAANPNLAAGAQMVHDYTRALLKKMYDGGLIEADLFEKLMKEDFYVPFYRDMRDKPMAGKIGGGSSPDGPGMTAVVKRMVGSDRDIIDPIQSLQTQTFLVNRTLQHNDIIKSFVALARSAQAMGATGTGRILEELPAHQIVGKKFDLAEAVKNKAREKGIDDLDTKVLLGGLADVFGDDPIMATVFRREPVGKKGEPIVFYKDGGELKAVRFVSKEEGVALYEALSQLPPVAQDWALSIGQMSASALRAGVVTNPVFAVTNFIRDQIAAFTLRSDYIPFNPRGLISETRQDKWADLYTYAGGVSPGAGAQGLHDMIEHSIDAMARKGWAVQKIGGLGELVTGHGVKRITGPAKALGEIVEVAEAGTRLNVMRTVFEQKKLQGLSDYDAMIEAAAQATDLMDFGRHGSGTLYIRTLVPFLNAHLQGLDKAWRTLVTPVYRAFKGDMVTEGDVAALKNAGLSWFKMAGVGGALGYMYSLWAQNHRAYQDANAELRATHLIIPGSAFGYDGKILVIPKPFELAIGFNLGEMMGLKIGASDPRAADMALAGAMEVIAPPNVLTSIPIVKTYAELALNRSFFTGRDIVPERLQALKPQEQFTEKTSNFSRQIGTFLGVSPIKVDYAVGATFGLYGRDLLALSNTADPNAPAPSLEDQMLVRRFIKSADSASETTKRFWDQAAQRNGQLAKAKQTYESMLGQFRDADAIQFLGALPKLEKSFVVLNASSNEDGKPAFSADEKRLHPLARAAIASTTLIGMVRELSRDAQTSYEDGSRINMDPAKRRDVIEQLRVLSAMEQYNALIIAKDKGYENRRLEDTTKQLEVIKAHDAKAGAEVATRYATAKIPPIAAVAKVWPEIEKRLLSDGGKADLSDLVGDVTADGYEFGGERVKRPAKRRIQIAPSMLGAPAQ